MEKKYEDCIIKTEKDIAEVHFNKTNLEALDEIVYLDFSVKPGQKIKKGDKLLVLESMKGTSELESKIEGEVKEINSKLEENPEILNEKPDTWIIRIKL